MEGNNNADGGIGHNAINPPQDSQYSGADAEDPHEFIDRFLMICDTTKHNGVPADAIRLRLFPFAVKGSALKWIERQPANTGGSIRQSTSEQALDLIKKLARDENESVPTSVKRGVIKQENNDTLLAELLSKKIDSKFDSLAQQFHKFQVSHVQSTSQEAHESNECSNSLSDDSPQQVQVSERIPGTFPSNTVINPKEDCVAITTRSGKVVAPLANPTLDRAEDKEQEEKQKGAVEPEAEVIVKEKEKEAVIEKEKPSFFDKNCPLTHEYIMAQAPYPERFKKEVTNKHYDRFLDIFKKLHINIPFAEALANMPGYAKFMKDLLKKNKLQECQTVELTAKNSAFIQQKIPAKLRDPGSFNIPITIDDIAIGRAICDLGANINLMPLSIYKSLGIEELKPTEVSLQLADRSVRKPNGIIEDVLVKGMIKLRMHDEELNYNVFEAMKRPAENDDCFQVEVFQEQHKKMRPQEIDYELRARDHVPFEGKEVAVEELKEKADDIEDKPPKVELKTLPDTLKYVFLGNEETYHVIVNTTLSPGQEKELVEVLKAHKTAIGWSISDLKGINPSICTHKILMAENIKP
ncbi:uncharacterized protein LOC133318386, partial [Gastrolobium bilobum]|uniref:uncharacterized protein LOC133318386 n=1 Tax=Gastrolobium bilobum TaxID=150636 RepID=UPI002AB0BA64